MRTEFTRLLWEKRARRDPAARYERGGSPAARGKRVNFARINIPVISIQDILRQFQNSLTEPRKQASKVAESVQKECLGIPDI